MMGVRMRLCCVDCEWFCSVVGCLMCGCERCYFVEWWWGGYECVRVSGCDREID
ncbi:hypothetical protein GPU96_10g20630 [Encephalitozoon hellem]|uniref:Uncharacterized protein n=1 Tax=Encephalitozoon hellem TaxID=27973 RepID=A0A9Q9FAE5_ENCHE|nr:hypothetical protein GPU96_10g20630 [Encephalitozoon hellem]